LIAFTASVLADGPTAGGLDAFPVVPLDEVVVEPLPEFFVGRLDRLFDVDWLNVVKAIAAAIATTAAPAITAFQGRAGRENGRSVSEPAGCPPRTPGILSRWWIRVATSFAQ
jgi:hypothetical protein